MVQTHVNDDTEQESNKDPLKLKDTIYISLTSIANWLADTRMVLVQKKYYINDQWNKYTIYWTYIRLFNLDLDLPNYCCKYNVTYISYFPTLEARRDHKTPNQNQRCRFSHGKIQGSPIFSGFINQEIRLHNILPEYLRLLKYRPKQKLEVDRWVKANIVVKL